MVSRVLTGNGQVSTRAQESVLHSVAELGYSSNAAAQALALGRTGNIGLLVRRSSSPYYGQLMFELQAHATEAGYRMIAVTGNLDIDSEARALRTLLELRVDGLVIGSGNLPTAKFQELSRSIPTVVIGREAAGSNADVVRVDSEAQAHIAANLLRGQGHRRVGCVTVPHSLSAQPRHAALREAFGACGVQLIEQPGGYDTVEAAPAARTLISLRPRPTALLSLSHDGALALLGEAHRAGLSVPANISVLALDDPPTVQLPGLEISTVAQGVPALAKEAWTLLAERLADPTLPPRECLVPGRYHPGTTLGQAAE